MANQNETYNQIKRPYLLHIVALQLKGFREYIYIQSLFSLSDPCNARQKQRGITRGVTVLTYAVTCKKTQGRLRDLTYTHRFLIAII